MRQGAPSPHRRPSEGATTVTWFWMNIPLSVLLFGTVTGIPLWLVIMHPDTGPVAPDTKPDVPAATGRC